VVTEPVEHFVALIFRLTSVLKPITGVAAFPELLAVL